MKLSENFTLDEMTKSDVALRNHLDNTPGDTEIKNMVALAENVLQPVRDHYGRGVHVNSGYRSPAVNSAARGSASSEHVKGMAADIEIPGISNADLAHWIADNLDFTQLILEFYTPGVPSSGWVHVSYNPANLKKEMLTAVSKDKKTVYLPGLQA